jgi:HNH endonuclease/NUMOD4 motif
VIEQWKTIDGWPYEISNLGRVKRVAPWSDRNRRHQTRIIKPQKNTWGYVHVNLSKHGHRWVVTVHRLVATAFMGSCPEGMEVNHKNGDKTDPRLDNLEYVTHSANVRHALRIGLSNPPKGDAHYTRKRRTAA